MTNIPYDVACARYASDQGLDPVGTVLTLSGIPWNLEQTGGFCMVVNVEHIDEAHYLWITNTGPDLFLVGMYDGGTGDMIGETDDEAYDEVTLSSLVEYINERRTA